MAAAWSLPVLSGRRRARRIWGYMGYPLGAVGLAAYIATARPCMERLHRAIARIGSDSQEMKQVRRRVQFPGFASSYATS